MKKFGTPIGAAPGNANENVGFDAFGTPPAPRNLPVFFPVLPFAADPPVLLEPVFDFDFDFDFDFPDDDEGF
jgi:hypothetical protein